MTLCRQSVKRRNKVSSEKQSALHKVVAKHHQMLVSSNFEVYNFIIRFLNP